MKTIPVLLHGINPLVPVEALQDEPNLDTRQAPDDTPLYEFDFRRQIGGCILNSPGSQNAVAGFLAKTMIAEN